MEFMRPHRPFSFKPKGMSELQFTAIKTKINVILFQLISDVADSSYEKNEILYSVELLILEKSLLVIRIRKKINSSLY